jgi:predicted transcriptional regulator of viral defense system
MKYLEFKSKLLHYPLFSTNELKLLLGADFNRSLLNNLKRWEKDGLIIKLRKGLYLLKVDKEFVNPMILAEKIYSPSYISLEMALNWYGIIPEAVFTVTSISTKKSNFFTVPSVGYFSYQTIKKRAFGGYKTFVENGISYNLAEPEKALLDFFYLNKNIMDGTDNNFLSYRFSELFRYNNKRIKELVKYYSDKKTTFLANKFISFNIRRKKGDVAEKGFF